MTESLVKPQGPRTVRDLTLDIFSDFRYHSAYDLEHAPKLKSGDWIVAVRELSEYGYSFGRRGNSLIMRKRMPGDSEPDFSELFAGIDARESEDMNMLYAHDRRLVEIRAEQGLGPKPDQETVPLGVMRAFGDLEDGDPGPSDDQESHDSGEQAPVNAVEDSDRLILSVDGRECVLSAKAYVTGTYAVLAKKKSGKTYLAMVIAEEFLRKKLPFAVIDPTGVWFGLGALLNGQPSPFNLLVVGGRHGVRAIQPEDGRLAAKFLVARWPYPVVFDLSEMVPEDQHMFVADFGSQLYTINRRPVHLFVDECDEFAPQSPESSFKHQRRCLQAMDRLVRRGRVKGIGTTEITQRPAVINKNVLSQMEGYFLMNMGAPHDLEAVDSWMSPIVTMQAARYACKQALPTLRVGEVFYMHSGSMGPPLVRFMVKPKTTFDSSCTPTMDNPDPPAPHLADPDPAVLAAYDELFETSASVTDVPEKA